VATFSEKDPWQLSSSATGETLLPPPKRQKARAWRTGKGWWAPRVVVLTWVVGTGSGQCAGGPHRRQAVREVLFEEMRPNPHRVSQGRPHRASFYLPPPPDPNGSGGNPAPN